MGKKSDKTVSKDRHSATHIEESDKSDEPYKCIGNFLLDYSELCKQKNMSFIPRVMSRSKLPLLQPVVSDIKLDKKGDKKQQAPLHEAELEVEVPEVSADGPPKTFITKDKIEYFKPSVQVELESEKWDSVTEVYVRGWKIDMSMMDVFHHCWLPLSKLHTINLWNTGLTGETVHFLATFLPQCSNVKNVILDGNSVKEENWSELIPENSLIQNLSLRFCNITDKGASELAVALRNTASANTKLLSLNLAGNHIGDDGVEQFAESLRTNRTLLSLILTSNKIGDRGAVKLAETLFRIPLTQKEVVMRRTLMSEREALDVKSPVPHKRPEPKERPVSVSKSVTLPDKSKQKTVPKKKDVKLKDSKDDIKSPKKEKEDPKSKKEPRGNRGVSSATDVSKVPSKIKEKKKERGKASSTEPDNVDSHDQISPLLDPADYHLGQLWIEGNRTLINLNLSRNQIGEVGVAALLKAVQHQVALKSDNKSGPVGLMRLVVCKNAVSPESESIIALNEMMLVRDPFYKPPAISETSLVT